MGSVPEHSLDRDAGGLCTGRILLAEQEGSELFPLPRHRETGRGCTYGRKVQSEPEGLHGDHETLHDKG